MDTRERAAATQVRALFAKLYGTDSGEYGELNSLIVGYEDELGQMRVAARRRDEEIAALKEERDFYLAAIGRTERRVMEILNDELRQALLFKVATDVREGESVLVPAPPVPDPTEPIHSNGSSHGPE